MSSGTSEPNTASSKRGFSPLDLIEWIGNKLPDPVTLFAIGALLVMVASWVADRSGWEVVQTMPTPVEVEVLDEDGEPVVDPDTGEAVTKDEMVWEETGEVFRPKNLLSREGIDWAFRTMVDNFINFAPLGVVLAGMLGIGVAERTGLLAAALKGFMQVLRWICALCTPRRWDVADKILTPSMVFIGIMSSLATDAGYVVLPPLAAALYKSVGRSPLAGMAAVFAGVSAGFSANLLITGLEPMLAELTGTGATIIDPDYRVNPMCNWWFMIVSTVLITFTGWFVTAFFVERRLKRRSPEEGGPDEPSESELAEQQLKPEEKRGLVRAGAGLAVFGLAVLALVMIPGAPLHTYHMPESGQMAEVWTPSMPDDAVEVSDDVAMVPVEGDSLRWIDTIVPLYMPDTGQLARVWTPDAVMPDDAARVSEDTVLVPSDRVFSRWVDAIVPLLFLGFLIPGIAYGVSAGEIKTDKDAAKLMMESMAAMAPIIVLAFVAGQFIEYFSYTGLDRMLAMWGGMKLGQVGMSSEALIIAFILLTLLFNLFMGSMSAKYALFAPIFVPMFMMVGISPELTQAAYRVGDSVSNIITPLNAYLIIILVFMQKYVPKGGMGTLVATMFPYTVVFTIIWSIMLVIWMQTGLPLGLDGGLSFDTGTIGQ